MNISTRLVDSTHGVPAAGVNVRLDRHSSDAWLATASVATGRDGRINQWYARPSVRPESGRYRLVFDTGTYFAELGIATCLPEIVIVFFVSQPDRGYHIEIMASAHGYGVYCGNE